MEPFSIPGSFKHSSFTEPMLATASERPFKKAGWIFELKYDGWRAIAEVQNAGEIKLYSRNGLSFLKAFPEVHDALKKINLPVILDGEIIVQDRNGKVSFQDLQNFGNNRKGKAVYYYVFDCLWMNGQDLRTLPLVQRKELLRHLFEQLLADSNTCIKFVDHDEDGLRLFEYVKKFNLEGIIGKLANSTYVSKRSKNWLKIKNKRRGYFIVVGMLEGKGSRQYFGGLVLAEKIGENLFYRGHVGSGFTDKQLKQTYEMLIPHVASKPPVVAPKFKNKVTWLKPKYFCQVEFTELTEEEVLRHPVFLGLRADKQN